MGLLIDETFLPATLTCRPMSDEEFAALCGEYPDLFFEMTSEGDLIVSGPTYTLTGVRNAVISGQLGDWAKADDRGVVTGPCAGFVLPNGARRSADAAWTSREAIGRLSQKSYETYWHLCPELVIELRSRNDRLLVLREKMVEWISNGAQLGWLIDLEAKTVEVFRAYREVELLTDVDSVKGEGLLDGFTLDLSRVWDPLAGR